MKDKGKIMATFSPHPSDTHLTPPLNLRTKEVAFFDYTIMVIYCSPTQS